MEPTTGPISRRTVLGAGVGVPMTAMLLTGCGEGSPGPDSGGEYGPAQSRPSRTGPASSSTQDPGEPGGPALAAVADIPVGGALVVEDGPDGKPVVLARPRDGEVVAFSAVCTHKGCTVKAEESALACPCHGSTFDLTGANTGGPAPSPLPKVEVTVTDGQVRPA